MKEHTPIVSRYAIKRRVRRLLATKYNQSIVPYKSVASDLKAELTALGHAEEDHIIAVMNMSGRKY